MDVLFSKDKMVKKEVIINYLYQKEYAEILFKKALDPVICLKNC